MMIQCEVDGLQFEFPEHWSFSKYDDWAFYHNQFRKMWKGIKAVDIIALDPSLTFWLIEAKDFRRHRRTKPTSLPDEVARKVYDTLAAILPAKVNASKSEEAEMAAKVARAQRIRVVFHMEQPLKPSKLFPRAIDPADVQQKIRQLLHPIDPHTVVVETGDMRNLAWSVK
jgi:hypothetical protein